jgi:hypothetical protein
MRTVICHFFNEEYMLPWWLKHHTGLFDYGILIDHGSTDNSANICRELAPDWRLVRSRLTHFDAYMTDFEVMQYEQELPGWKIALNVTEFLMTSVPLEALEQQLVQQGRSGCAASGMLIVDDKPDVMPDPAVPLPLQQHFGVDDNTVVEIEQRHALALPTLPQRNRFYHRNQVGMYQPGRHQSFHPDSRTRIMNLMVFHYGYAPWNERALQRKIQIATKLKPEDISRGWGAQHTRGLEQLQQDYLKIKAGAFDLRSHEHANAALELCCRY